MKKSKIGLLKESRINEENMSEESTINKEQIINTLKEPTINKENISEEQMINTLKEPTINKEKSTFVETPE